MQVPAGDAVELDCLGLSYCSAGGTGRALEGGAFPGDYDTDADGFGAIFRGTTGDFQLGVGATAAQIGSGDAFIQHITTGATTTQVPGILNYLFATTPALARWADRTGTSGSVTYPAGPGTSGTAPNPISLTAGATTAMSSPRPCSGARSARRSRARARAPAGSTSAASATAPTSPTAHHPEAPDAGDAATAPPTPPATRACVQRRPGARHRGGPAGRPGEPAHVLCRPHALSVQRRRDVEPGRVAAVDIQARSNYGDNAAQKVYFRRG